MGRLAVIVAQGGINSAGRTSGFNAYKRLVFNALSQQNQASMLASLRQLCGEKNNNDFDRSAEHALLSQTLVRKLNLFRTDAVTAHHKMALQENSELIVRKKQLPDHIPSEWQVIPLDDAHVKIVLTDHLPFLTKVSLHTGVDAAGQLPDGFHPETLYASRSHPRGLAMTVYGASDAVQSMGIDWETIRKKVPADKVSVYAGSSMSQLDQHGNGGLLQARLKGERVSAKQLALGFSEMPADFINAYILGSLGGTGTNIGACATFLYNLKQGMEDIRTGKARIVVVGNSEAPLTPEIIEGYTTMGAMATNKALKKLDHKGPHEEVDYTRACRPFAENAGFTLGESAQFFVLMDDELALECGASIMGSVADVFVNADGYKKSISSPGAGNYITVAKAIALGKKLFGAEALQHSTVYAHGTGTPQNRVTESHILSQVAGTFGIHHWPIAAIKSYVGHSLATAAGDQLMAALGMWKHGIIPGIKTIDKVADDTRTHGLNILKDHLPIDAAASSLSFLNSKGFGGNNATATIISPYATEQMLIKKHGQSQITAWKRKNEAVQSTCDNYENQCCTGKSTPTYRFGEHVIEAADIKLTQTDITLKNQKISLNMAHPYDDYL